MCDIIDRKKELIMSKSDWRTKNEVVRDKVLLIYPEWSEWTRDLKRIFVLLPSYGAGWDGIENMCKDLGAKWEYEKVKEMILGKESFVRALEEYKSNGYKYRTSMSEFVDKTKTKWRSRIKWSQLQHAYLIESGITSFIKGEVSKISASEAKLVEKSMLLELQPAVSQESSKNESDTGTPESLVQFEELAERYGG